MSNRSGNMHGHEALSGPARVLPHGQRSEGRHRPDPGSRPCGQEVAATTRVRRGGEARCNRTSGKPGAIQVPAELLSCVSGPAEIAAANRVAPKQMPHRLAAPPPQSALLDVEQSPTATGKSRKRCMRHLQVSSRLRKQQERLQQEKLSPDQSKRRCRGRALLGH